MAQLALDGSGEAIGIEHAQVQHEPEGTHLSKAELCRLGCVSRVMQGTASSTVDSGRH